MDAWDVKVFQRHRNDDPDERCPAKESLNVCPDSVAADLIAIIDALSKPHNSPFTDADYARVRRLGDEYRRRVPRNVG